MQVWSTAISGAISTARQVRPQILEAIGRSDEFVILIGENGVKEESWQDEELEYALLQLKERTPDFRLYVVLMPRSTDKCLPEKLKARLRERMQPDEADVFRHARADQDLTEARAKARAFAWRLGLRGIPAEPIRPRPPRPDPRRKSIWIWIGIVVLTQLAGLGYVKHNWIVQWFARFSNANADSATNTDATQKPPTETPPNPPNDPWVGVQTRVGTADPKYERSLKVQPIANFEPLGPDPQSHFEEFYVIGTGPKPERGANGELGVREPSGEVKGLGHAGLVMVLLPGGKYLMGSADDDELAWSNERPQHEVTVLPFYLAKTEFTNLHRSVVEGATPAADKIELPVTEITWDESKVLCDRLSLRLPSESEWEYGCRAKTMTRYFFGDDEIHAKNYEWYFLNSGSQELSAQTRWDDSKLDSWKLVLRPVATRIPSPFGLCDVSGNAFEWCEDDWHRSYSDAGRGDESSLGRMDSKRALLLAPSDGTPWVDFPRSPFRVLRGGSFKYSSIALRSANRLGDDIGYHNDSLGFRPARSLRP